jgi:hypothetical protein
MSYKNDFFSQTNPDLINSKSLSDLNKIIISDSAPPKTMSNLSENLVSFYKKYIQANILPIIIIVIFVSFIIYRYMTHSSEDFDPSKSISSPQNLLEQSDILNNTVKNENKLKNIDTIINDEILNDDSIYDDIVIKPNPDSREVYTGTINRWNGARDDEMEHPLGYDNNFISTTADTIGAFASKNKESINLASKMLFN